MLDFRNPNKGVGSKLHTLVPITDQLCKALNRANEQNKLSLSLSIKVTNTVIQKKALFKVIKETGIEQATPD